MSNKRTYQLPEDAMRIIKDHPDFRQTVVNAPYPLVCHWYTVINGYVFSTRERSWLVSRPGLQARMMEVTYE